MRDLNEERKIYNPINVKQIVQQYDYMEQLKKKQRFVHKRLLLVAKEKQFDSRI